MADYAQIVQQGNATGLALPSESAALVFTSPPYNTGIENRVGLPVYSHDVMPWRDYEDMAQAAAIEMDRILIQGGRVALNVQPAVPFSPIDKDDRRRVNLQQIWTEALEDAGLQYRDTIAWIQDSHDGACAWGSWARPTAPNFRGGWEVILIYFKAGTADKEGWRRDPNPKWADYKEERFGPGGDLTDCYRNVWKLRPARSDLKATFPVELPLRAIRTMTYPDDMVVDPFAGSGTTGIAAKIMGRPFYGVDLSETMAAHAATRIADAPSDYPFDDPTKEAEDVRPAAG